MVVKEHTRFIMLTGGTSGIGYQATIHFLRAGSRLLILCRNRSRVDSIKSSLLKENINQDIIDELASFHIVDLSDLNSIDNFIHYILDSKIVIDTLVLNAGLQYTGSKNVKRSTQNIELTFAVNHLSHYYLCLSVLPLLLDSQSPRIIITASEVHNPKSSGGRIGNQANLGNLDGLRNYQDFLMVDGSSIFDADKAYKDSKLCNVLFGKELSRRLKKNKIYMPVICWAPGLVIPRSKSGFFRYSRKYNEIGQRVFAFFARDLLKLTEDPRFAGRILKDLSISNKYLKKDFRYFSNQIKMPGKMHFEEVDVSLEASDELKAKELWDLSKALIEKIKGEDILINL